MYHLFDKNPIALFSLAIILFLVILRYLSYFIIPIVSTKTKMTIKSCKACRDHENISHDGQVFYKITCNASDGMSQQRTISVYPWFFDNCFINIYDAECALKSVKVGDTVYQSIFLWGGGGRYHIIPTVSWKGKKEIIVRIIFLSFFLIIILSIKYHSL